MTFQGHPRSLILAPIESTYRTCGPHVIIFEEFRPMWSRYLNVTGGQTGDLQ